MQSDSCKVWKSISKWLFFPRLQNRKGLKTASFHPLPEINSSCGSTGSLGEDLKKKVVSYFEPIKGHKAGAPFQSIKLRYIVIPKLRHWGPEHIIIINGLDLFRFYCTKIMIRGIPQ